MVGTTGYQSAASDTYTATAYFTAPVTMAVGNAISDNIGTFQGKVCSGSTTDDKTPQRDQVLSRLLQGRSASG